MWQNYSFSELEFSGKHSATPQLLREDYSFTYIYQSVVGHTAFIQLGNCSSVELTKFQFRNGSKKIRNRCSLQKVRRSTLCAAAAARLARSNVLVNCSKVDSSGNGNKMPVILVYHTLKITHSALLSVHSFVLVAVV